MTYLRIGWAVGTEKEGGGPSSDRRPVTSLPEMGGRMDIIRV